MLEKFRATATQIGSVIVGKSLQIRQSLTCLLAGGHLLIEDAPGVGKTTLAHAIAISLGLPFRRIQFTSDLLPSDVIGVSVYDRTSGQFVFHPGPIFTEVLLADEINRASPKTQSAMLEAMEESQVSVDGLSRPLPHPFFVIATQNPLSQVGTFPLPESQLDRFLMCISLGYPDRAAERALLAGEARRDMLKSLPAVARPSDLVAAQAEVKQRVRFRRAARLRAGADGPYARLRQVRRGPVTARRPRAAGRRARLGLARRTQSRDPRGRAERNAGGCRPSPACRQPRQRPRAARQGTRQPADRRSAGSVASRMLAVSVITHSVGDAASASGSPAAAARRSGDVLLDRRRVYILPTHAGAAVRRGDADAADRLDQLLRCSSATC